MSPEFLFKSALAIALAGMACAASSATTSRTFPVLIGTYTSGTSAGIYLYAFDGNSGTIGPAPVQVTKTRNPSWLTFSADHRKLYAVQENAPDEKDPEGRATAYAVQPETGRLTLINQVASRGAQPTYASTSTDGHFLFVANYSVRPDPGGTLAVLPIGADGALAPVTQVVTPRHTRRDPTTRKPSHVHSSVSSPDGRVVYVQDLGTDTIHVYRYDASRHDSPLVAMKDQPTIDLPAGSGPRHLTFDADGRHAYLSLEKTGQVAVFDNDDGLLTRRQMLPLAADGFRGQVAGGAIHLSPDGRFLYATDRGTDNQLVAFKVDPSTGELTFAGRRSVEGTEPREFSLDPSGHFILVANQHSHQIVVFRRDPVTGAIGNKVQALDIDQPSDVKFVNRP